MLKTIYNLKQFSFHQSFDNWEDAIYASYHPLLDAKVVNKNYIDNVIRCIKTFGPYIVIIPEVAMPHSSENADGCFQTAISFMKVETPVVFDPSDQSKNVRLFFSLAATNHEQHLKNIQELMDLFSNDEIMDELKNVHTADELKFLVQKYY